MRLEERIVLDGAAITTLEHGLASRGDTTPVKEVAENNHGAALIKGENSPVIEHKDTSRQQADLAANSATAVRGEQQTQKNNTSDDSADAITLLVTTNNLPDAAQLIEAAADDVVSISYDHDDDLATILEKITTSLDGKKAASIGFASHSLGPGVLHLADQLDVSLDSLVSNPEMATFWKNIGSLIKQDGSIDLMGCNLAQGEVGEDFVEKLEVISGKDVAASVDATGNGPNADWELEEGGVQLIGKYFEQQSLANYTGQLDGESITLGTTTLYDTDNDGAYEIDNAAKLIALSQYTSGWDKNYELTADIAFDANHQVDWDGDGTIGDIGDNAGFSPIGSLINSFSGNFFGNGHTISNLYINRIATNNVGLFGYYTGASITGLNLKDVDIKGWGYVGGLIGNAYFKDALNKTLTIKDSSVSGKIAGTLPYIGGLVGSAHFGSSQGNSSFTIENSSVSANVIGTGTANCIGGLVGYADFTSSVSSSFLIKKSSVTGDVTENNTTGGLVGIVNFESAQGSSCTIENAYVSGNCTSSSYVGGLLGYADLSDANDLTFTIKNTYCSGSVHGTDQYVGGLLGYADLSDANDLTFTIKNTYCSGNVHGYEDVGGLLGYAYNKLVQGNTTIQIAHSYFSGGEIISDNAPGGGIIGCVSHNNFTLSHYHNSTQLDAIGNNQGGITVPPSEPKATIVDHLLDQEDSQGRKIWIDRNGPLGDPVFTDNSKQAPTLALDTCSITAQVVSGVAVTEILSQVQAEDNNGDPLGIAVTSALYNNLGQWQYSTDNGATWENLELQENKAFLLEATDKVRFLASDGQGTGTVNVVFHAWDGTDGIAHTSVELPETLGGETAFSVNQATATAPINQAYGMSWDNNDRIESAKELIYLSQHQNLWNQSYTLATDIDFGTAHDQVDWNGDGKVDNDDAAGFTPIGNQGNPFSGTFAGNGHTINNLYINRSGTDNVGLFGYYTGASITGLNLENVAITGANNVAGLIGNAGFANASGKTLTIGDSFVSGNITGEGRCVGGLVGLAFFRGNSTNNSSFTLENSSVSASVSGAADYIGGLLGAAVFELSQSSSFLIRKSFVSGDVIGNNYTGGLIGIAHFGSSLNSSCTIENAYASGNCTGSDWVGGLLGSINLGLSDNFSFTMENTYSSGNVHGTDQYVGGLLGEVEAATVFNDTAARIAYSYFSGEASSDLADASVGKIIGKADNTANGPFITVEHIFYNTEPAIGTDAPGVTIADDEPSTKQEVVDHFDTSIWTAVDADGNPVFWGEANHAPTINDAVALTIDNISEVQVADILAANELNANDNDSNTLGIAVTATESSTGHWEYRANATADWQELNTGTAEQAFLLQDTAQIRFVDNGTSAGTVNFSFRVWDGTTGTANELVTLPDSCGGETAFSANQAIAQAQIDANFGTSWDGDHEIESAEELIFLSRHQILWDQNYTLATDIDFGDHTQVDWDGDGTVGDADDAAGFSPIGNEGNSFSGTFTGNGHTISNLYIDRSDTDNVGLFGYYTGTSITGLNLEDVVISGAGNVAALIGNADFRNSQNSSLTIADCSLSGSISGSRYVGGFLGEADFNNAESSPLTITHCFSSADVEATYYGGGFIGEVGFVTGSSSPFTIKNCYNSGDVLGRPHEYGGQDLGGLIGRSYMSADTSPLVIENVYTSGKIGKGWKNNVGGLIGNATFRDTSDYRIKNSYASGEISGRQETTGGIIGRAEVRNGTVELADYFHNGAKVIGRSEIANGGQIIDPESVTKETVVNHLLAQMDNEGNKIWTNTNENGILEDPVFSDNSNQAPTLALDTCSITAQVVSGVAVTELLSQVQAQDSNGDPLGIAVTNALHNNLGQWQYSTDNGATWENLELQADKAFLLEATDKVRFLADDGLETGTVNVVFHAWDGTDGTVHTSVNLPETLGGETAFSANQATATASINQAYGMSWDGDTEIESAKELIYLSQHQDLWDQDYTLATNIDFGAAHDQVDWNGDGVLNVADDRGFRPMGSNASHAFTGTFDGENHTISNLYIKSQDTNYIGLFGFYKGSLLSNINLQDVAFTGKDYVGGVAGYVYAKDSESSSFSIDNCSVSGNISGNNHVGEVAGFANFKNAKASSLTIENCFTSGNISGGKYIAGVLGGSNFGSSELSSSLNINNCSISSNVSGNDHIGGVIGYSNFENSNSSSLNIIDCSVSGNIHAQEHNVGGLVAYTYFKNAKSSSLTITNGHTFGDISGENNLGGLLGRAYFQDSESSFLNINNSSTSGNISGSNRVGGMMGFAYFADSRSSSLNITNCFTSGNVSGTRHIGGIIGAAEFEESESSSFAIENVYASGSIAGTNDVGGLIGSASTWTSATSQIQHCYTSGTISGSNRVGGLLGYAKVDGGKINITQYYHSVDPAIGQYTEENQGVITISEPTEKNTVITHLLSSRNSEAKPIWTEVDASGNLLDDPVFSDGSNHAPTLLSGAAWDISSRITQGIQVTELLEHFSAGDNDRDTLGAALAITENTGAGIFEYSIDDGNSWQTLDPGDAATSILLGATDRIRLVNEQGAAKTARFTLRAWDRSSGTLHDTVVIDDSSSGGTTAFSAEIGNLDVAIAEEPSPPVDPPVDPTPNEAPILGITEHDASGVIEQGISVADILNMFEAEDPDGYDASLQMRITGIDAAHGIWQVKRAYDNTWQDLDMTTSRFLNPQDMIRFVPEPGYKEQVSLSFVAVDADFDSSNSATLTATPENHAPTLDTGIPAWNISDQITAGITMAELLDHFSANDSDRDPVGAALAITENTGAGVFEYSTDDGNTWQTLDPGDAATSILLGGTDRIRLTNEQDAAKTARFTLRAWDGSSGTLHDTVVVDGNNSGDAKAFSAESGELQVTIAPPPNVAPVLGITERDASGVIEQGISVADILNMFEAEDPDGDDAYLQMRITGIDTAHGVWQVKRADGNSWQALDVTTSQPLSSHDMIRFVSEPGHKEQVSLSFVAIDADDSSNPATLTATPVNQKPQMEAQSLDLGAQLKSSPEQIAADVANTVTVQQLFDVFGVTDADDAIETLRLKVTSLDRAGGVWLYRDQRGNWQHITEGTVLSGTAELTYNGTAQEDVASLSFKVMDSESSSINTATITIPKPVADNNTEPGNNGNINPDDTSQVQSAFITPKRAGSPEYLLDSHDSMSSSSDAGSNNLVSTIRFANAMQPAPLLQDIDSDENVADDLAPSLAALKAVLNDTNIKILDDAGQKEALGATLIDSIAEMFVYLVGRQNLDGKDMARLENLLFASGVYEQTIANCRVYFDAALFGEIATQGGATSRLAVANNIIDYLDDILNEIVTRSSSEQTTVLLTVLENIFQTIRNNLSASVTH